ADPGEAGVCVGATPVVCPALARCDDAGAGDPTSALSSTPDKANGTACNDGSACTLSDSCRAGICTGNPVVCTALDQCHDAGTCDPANGTCSNPAKPNGSACSDGNGCTQSDTSQAGASLPAPP